MSNEEPIDCSVDGPVAVVTIDRPDARNAMTTGMVGVLHRILTELSARSDVRIVVLTGSGMRFFCPGADLRPASGPSQVPEIWQMRVPVLLHEMPQVTIAAINGACAGAGLGWACACDLRIATASAKFNTAFLDVGVAGDMGLPWSLSRILGWAHAMQLFLVSGKFGADEAMRMGLVSEVHPDETFRTKVDLLVGRLAAAAPDALRTIKSNFLATEQLDFRGYVDLESERHFGLVAGADFLEGRKAFVEGRDPRFG